MTSNPNTYQRPISFIDSHNNDTIIEIEIQNPNFNTNVDTEPITSSNSQNTIDVDKLADPIMRSQDLTSSKTTRYILIRDQGTLVGVCIGEDYIVIALSILAGTMTFLYRNSC